MGLLVGAKSCVRLSAFAGVCLCVCVRACVCACVCLCVCACPPTGSHRVHRRGGAHQSGGADGGGGAGSDSDAGDHPGPGQYSARPPLAATVHPPTDEEREAAVVTLLDIWFH